MDHQTGSITLDGVDFSAAVQCDVTGVSSGWGDGTSASVSLKDMSSHRFRLTDLLMKYSIFAVAFMGADIILLKER